jgi:ornithine decarboxylase
VGRYGSPLFVIDAERIRRQYRRLAAALGRVDIHYALKPLPHSSVIDTLQAEGACFDLATNGEVELMR